MHVHLAVSLYRSFRVCWMNLLLALRYGLTLIRGRQHVGCLTSPTVEWFHRRNDRACSGDKGAGRVMGPWNLSNAEWAV
jgi:hypothetical protein